MTLRDTEIIELLADKPELLAIADAVSATQRAARPIRRRIVTRAAVLAAAVAAVIVAVLAAPQSHPSGIIGRALAAVGDARIMHVVTEAPPEGAFINLKTGRRSALVLREELWTDRQLDHFHLVLSLNGRIVGDLLYPADARNGVSPLTPNPAFLALWTGYRAALRNGSVTLVGRGTVGGRRVYWLLFKQSGHSPVPTRSEVAVDARTYKPVLYRYYANGRHFDERILAASTIPYRPAEFERRGPSLAGGGSGGGMSSGPINPSAPPKAVHAPWLTAGPSVAGLRLRSVYPLKVFSGRGGKHRSFTGLGLTYGPRTNAFSTTVEELPRPDDPSAWRFVPVGSMEVEMGEGSSSSQAHKSKTYTIWTGRLKKHGLYITISTPKGEVALLAIARSLHPGR